MNAWNIGIYARVSTEKYDQRESIPAQIQGLKEWIVKKSKEDKNSIYNLEDIYEDYGFSGSNFERDSFIKMKEDIECKKINMVLTRDLSRFSRNYILAGYYLEDYFKTKGVRFVSVLDNVDTIEEFNDIIPFKNILNEMYIKDCSRRTRDGLKQRMIRGSSIASKPPYGYKFQEIFDGNIKTIKLVIAEDETTSVVREIYKLYISGWGFGKIANYLNTIGINPPSYHLKSFGKSKFFKWNSNSIKYILTNPKYSGQMIQGRWKKVSYKLKKVKVLPKDKWIYGGEFEGIVSKEGFEEVQELIKKKSKCLRYKNDELHLFSGVLKCGDCGGSMCYRKNYQGYKCTNSQTGGGRCTAHSIKEDSLNQIIIKDLKKFTDEHINIKSIYNYIIKELAKENRCENELGNIEKELKQLDNQFQRIYADKLNKVINERNAKNLMDGIEQKQDFLLNRRKDLSVDFKKVNNKDSYYEVYKEKLGKILNFEKIDRYIVESFIDKIIIYEKKAEKEKSINIYYKFKV